MGRSWSLAVWHMLVVLLASCFSEPAGTPSDCRLGAIGCRCQADEVCESSELTCREGYCIPATCEPGEKYCYCNAGTCDDPLTCQDDAICLPPAGGDDTMITGMTTSTTAVDTSVESNAIGSSTENGDTSRSTENGDMSSSAETSAPPLEICNGVDDDGDGAIDEYSPENLECAGCVYQVVASGSVQSRCTGPVSWEDARLACIALGAHLASIHSQADNVEVWGATMGEDAHWLGLNDIEQEGSGCGRTARRSTSRGGDAASPTTWGGARTAS